MYLVLNALVCVRVGCNLNSTFFPHLLQWLTFFSPNCFSVKHLRSNLKRGDSVTDSKFSLQDCSHSLVSEKLGYVIRNLPFWCCAINCAGGEVIKSPSGRDSSCICSGSDLHIWAAGLEGSQPLTASHSNQLSGTVIWPVLFRSVQ